MWIGCTPLRSASCSNQEGAINTSYTYDPFGTASSSGAPSDNPYQYTGRENDGEGLQYNRARYYDPAIGRFISQDSLGIAGDGPNLYWYGVNDPLDHVDPSGLCVVSCFDLPDPIGGLEHLIGAAADAAGNQIGRMGQRSGRGAQ